MAHRERNYKRSLPNDYRLHRTPCFGGWLYRLNPLVTYPLNINDYGKEKKQERITAVQVLRGGQHLRVYG